MQSINPSSQVDRPFLPRTLALMFRRIRKAIASYPKATLFELRDQGFNSIFEQLVACVISIRTLDEVSLPCSLRLFKVARSPKKLARLTIEEIDELIRPATFHRQKSQTLKTLAQEVCERFHGELPADDDILQSIKGIGPKCAHLALGIAADLPFIGVDIHVHRVTNRWGLVKTSTPPRTMAELEDRLPRRHWIEINELLVPFGKHVCTVHRPFCTRCPVYRECQRVGVKYWR